MNFFRLLFCLYLVFNLLLPISKASTQEEYYTTSWDSETYPTLEAAFDAIKEFRPVFKNYSVLEEETWVDDTTKSYLYSLSVEPHILVQDFSTYRSKTHEFLGDFGSLDEVIEAEQNYRMEQNSGSSCAGIRPTVEPRPDRDWGDGPYQQDSVHGNRNDVIVYGDGNEVLYRDRYIAQNKGYRMYGLDKDNNCSPHSSYQDITIERDDRIYRCMGNMELHKEVTPETVSVNRPSTLPEYENSVCWRNYHVKIYAHNLPPRCDCDENFGSDECIARDVSWSSESQFDDKVGAILEISDENNQGRKCGRIIPDEPCGAPEGPIQNLDQMGNPISCASGKKIQAETDYQASVGGLNFSRSYIKEPNTHSGDIAKSSLSIDIPNDVQILESQFASSHYDSWTDNIPQLHDNGQGVKAFVNKGTRRVFNEGAAFRAEHGYLVEESQGTTYHSINGTEYHFNSDNLLTKKVFRNGQYQDFSYPSELKTVITDNFGRKLHINYQEVQLPNGESLKVTSKITDPAGDEYKYEYNSFGLLKKVIYPDETPENQNDTPYKEYHYSQLSQGDMGLTGITDELGNLYAEWDYDSLSRANLSQHADGAGKVTVTYYYPTNGIYKSRVEHYRNNYGGRETLYEFKKLNGTLKPVKVTPLYCNGCEVGQTQYQYDANGYLSQITSPEGDITKYNYNLRGLLESKTEAFGTAEERTVTTTWHGSYKLPLTIDEPQRLTTYSYDANGNLLSRSVKDKGTNETRTVSYTYNGFGQVLTVDGPRTDVSDITTYDYDTSGNLTKVTNALGHETLITSHDAHGKPLSITDPNGTVTTLTYHPRGWLTSVTTNGDTTTYGYDKAGQLTSVTMANGVVLNYEYDAAHRLVAIEDAAGNRIGYTLDNYGNRTRTDIKDSTGTIKSYAQQVYNDLGQLKQTLGANNQANDFDYDAEGKPTQSEDALDNPTTQHFDALDRLQKVVDPALGETEFDYDNQDRLTSVTDATNKTTSYQYNAFGDVLSITSPDTGTTSMTYDSAGNVLTTTDARNITATYSYDALNRVTHIDYPGTTEDMVFTYDSIANGNKGVGRLTQVTDKSGSTAYEYDAKGQLVAETRTINGTNFTTGYVYDDAGLITQITYPSGRTVDYQRNTLGQITSMTTTASGQTQTIANNISYLPFGPLANLTYGNGKVLTQSFDQDYRLTSKHTTGLYQLGYGYTPRNNIDAITDALDSSKNQSFSYDVLARLTDASGQYGVQDYTFDAIGNRLSKSFSFSGKPSVFKRYSIRGYSNLLESDELVVNIGTETYSWMVTSSMKESWRWPKKLAELISVGSDIALSGDVQELNSDGVYAPIASGYRNIIDVFTDAEVSVSLNGTDISHLALKEEAVSITPEPLGNFAHYAFIGFKTLSQGDEVKLVIDDEEVSWIVDEYWKETWRWPMKTIQLIKDNWSSSTVEAGESSNGYQPIASSYRNNITFIDSMKDINVFLNGNEVTTEALRPIYVTMDNIDVHETENYVYASDSHRLLSFNSQGLTYDAAGNTLTKGDLTFTYNQMGRLATASKAGMNASYTYNAQGQRVKKTVDDGTTSVTTLYHYDQGGQLIAETSGQGSLLREYLYLDNMRIASIDNGDLYHVHTDHLGAPLALTDSSGTVQWKGSYDPYGNVTVEVNNIDQTQRFPGQRYSAETGLHYNYFRDYDPEIGRYLQSDPIGLNGGMNTYGYVGGNPVNFVDIVGLYAEHTKNARKSTLGKHQKGQANKQIARGGERGDRNRSVPRKRPPGHKGPWPPKNSGAVSPSMLGRLLGVLPSLLWPSDLGCSSFDCDNDGYDDQTGMPLYEVDPCHQPFQVKD